MESIHQYELIELCTNLWLAFSITAMAPYLRFELR